MNIQRCLASCLVAACAFAAAGCDSSHIEARNAWARTTGPSQANARVFVDLQSPSAGKLVGVSTPSAKVARLHEVTLTGHVSRERAVDALDLPAGEAVQLKPGGDHIVLLGLTQELVAGQTVPLTLRVMDPAGKTRNVDVKVAIRAPEVHRHDDDIDDDGDHTGHGH